MNKRIHGEFINIFNNNHEFDFFAPGRVNLIGEHIDYNGGLVFPCAITLGTRLLVAKNNLSQFRFRTVNFKDNADIDIKKYYSKEGKNWYYYPLGVIQEFINKGVDILCGYDFLFDGNIPVGSGLSSSASIEIATAYALNEILKTNFSLLELVKMTKKAENQFIGVNSGIMDQFAVSFGKKDQAVILNCNTLDYEYIPCDLKDHYLAIINTNKPRTLADSKYNERVAECQEALTQIQKSCEIKFLCELDEEKFNTYAHLIKDPITKNRATHVVLENQRVKDAKKSLSNGNLAKFGELMYESHTSLKDLYEVSGKELDTVVEYCRQNSFITGARMTGAGFGGCAIALVKKGFEEQFKDELTTYYTSKIGYAPAIYMSEIGEGVHEVKL